MKAHHLFALLSVVLGTACNRATPTTSVARDLTSIAATRVALDAAMNAQNATSVAALFTTDGVYLEPDGREVIGRAALQTLLQKSYGETGSAPKVRSTAEEVKVAGEWAFGWGRLEAIRPAVGGPTNWVEGKYLHVYQRQRDGTWRIARASYNANPSEKNRLASN